MPSENLLKATRLRPLRGNEFRPNKDGSGSTEITITREVDGKFVVMPSLWSSQGKFVELKPQRAVAAAMSYEKATGKQFPRFSSIKEAGEFARQRSKAGGIKSGPLAR
jgi:hypothetical protein